MKLILSFLLLTACSTYTPRTCEQKAWEAAGNAMANVQYAFEEQTVWDKKVNCNSFPVCMETPIMDRVSSGYPSGPTSDTAYKGLNSRQAYDKAMASCGK